VPALLLVPEHPCGAGVVALHQHNSQWHLGKSEVAGLAGEPLQAFGPALAEIAHAAARAYRDAGAPQAFQHYRAQGGHALIEERFDTIIDWKGGAQLSDAPR